MTTYCINGLSEEPLKFEADSLEDAVRQTERSTGFRLVKLSDGEGQVMITSLGDPDYEAVPWDYEGDFRVEPGLRVIK